jgi:hypothetical protein
MKTKKFPALAVWRMILPVRSTNAIRIAMFTGALAFSCTLPAQNNLGLIGVQSVYGNYLQAHTDGEMHASNPHQNREETWYLYEVDAAQHIYALRNFRNGLFMSKQANTCTPAISESIGLREEWITISGAPRKRGYVAFQSLYDGTFLGTQVGGKDVSEGCGGEVNAVETILNTTNPNWPGWWVVSETPGDPGNGNDAFTTIGKVFSDIFGNIGPADVVAFLASLIP